MAKKKKTPDNTICVNKRANYEYTISETIEAGLELKGWEVKSLREKKIQINESYIIFKNNEAFLFGATITALKQASSHVVADPMRNRKLLLKRKEINKVHSLSEQSGLTIIPLSMYWIKSYVKLKIGIAKGKKDHDKRKTIKDRDWAIQKNKVMKNKSLS